MSVKIRGSLEIQKTISGLISNKLIYSKKMISIYAIIAPPPESPRDHGILISIYKK
jgi:hypothetical protein